MDEKMVSLRINDIPVTVPEGSTVLEAARSAGFNIPSLCFLKDINEIGACRICVVEVKGAKSLVASCVYPVAEGMEVYTNTERVRKSRQLTLELIPHPFPGRVRGPHLREALPRRGVQGAHPVHRGSHQVQGLHPLRPGLPHRGHLRRGARAPHHQPVQVHQVRRVHGSLPL